MCVWGEEKDAVLAVLTHVVKENTRQTPWLSSPYVMQRLLATNCSHPTVDKETTFDSLAMNCAQAAKRSQRMYT